MPDLDLDAYLQRIGLERPAASRGTFRLKVPSGPDVDDALGRLF